MNSSFDFKQFKAEYDLKHSLRTLVNTLNESVDVTGARNFPLIGPAGQQRSQFA